MAFNYQGFSTLGVNLNRQNYGPLDISNVFNSEADLKYYLSKGTYTTGVSKYWYESAEKKVVPYPYEGQVIATVINNVVKVYVLSLATDTTDGLVYEAKAIEPEVDGTTITKNSDGELQIVAPTNPDGSKTYNFTYANGVYSWVAVDTSTVEGLSTELSKIQSSVTSLSTTVNGAGTEGQDGYVQGLVSKVTANTDAIAAEATARANAIAAEATARTTAVAALEGKISAAETAANGYTDTKIEGVNTAVAGIETRVGAAEGEIDALQADVTKINLFFKDAAEDKTVDGTLQNALDTLVEIQNYITTDGAAAEQIFKDIDAIEASLEATGAIGKKIEANATKIADNDTAIKAIQDDYVRFEDVEKSKTETINGEEVTTTWTETKLFAGGSENASVIVINCGSASTNID
jgi:hypothetical protein